MTEMTFEGMISQDPKITDYQGKGRSLRMRLSLPTGQREKDGEWITLFIDCDCWEREDQDIFSSIQDQLKSGQKVSGTGVVMPSYRLRKWTAENPGKGPWTSNQYMENATLKLLTLKCGTMKESIEYADLPDPTDYSLEEELA